MERNIQREEDRWGGKIFMSQYGRYDSHLKSLDTWYTML